MFRHISAISLVGLGFVLGAISLYNGQPIVALMLLLAGAYAGLGVTLGILESWSNPYFKLAAAVIGALGLIGVFAYNRAFDHDLQRAHMEALYEIGVLETHCSLSVELRKVQHFGIAACASQGNSDQFGALVELSKGIHFGPTLTLADSAITSAREANPDFCAHAFREAVRLCPAAATFVSALTRRSLLSSP